MSACWSGFDEFEGVNIIFHTHEQISIESRVMPAPVPVLVPVPVGTNLVSYLYPLGF
jgi:hypothetical protein